jgi:hypothetical protein
MQLLRRADQEPIWADEGEKEAWFWRPQGSLYLNLDRQEGELLFSQDYWLDLFIILYFHVLLASRGLLLHASAVMRHRRACVFPGPSGAGKSTIVSHSPGAQVMAVDTMALLLAGKDNQPKAYSIPYFTDWTGKGNNLNAPVRAFYFPVKARENRVQPLSPRETLTHLLPCIWADTIWQPRLERLFDLAVQAAEKIPGFLLYFRPEPQLWQAIDGY